jgi:class 3 adenylate cyclase
MIAAARIQRMTRLFGVHVIADEETVRRLDGAVAHRALGTPRLKGLKERQVLHEVLTGPAPTAVGARAGDPAWTSRPS